MTDKLRNSEPTDQEVLDAALSTKGGCTDRALLQRLTNRGFSARNSGSAIRRVSREITSRLR